MRGTTVQRLVHVRDVLWYSGEQDRPARAWSSSATPTALEPDDFFITTDLAATGADVASRYAGRWSIEVCFRDVKQHLGAQNPQSWKRQGPERAASCPCGCTP